MIERSTFGKHVDLAAERKLKSRVAKILRSAGFDVRLDVQFFREREDHPAADIVASSTDAFGLTRKFGIECKESVGGLEEARVWETTNGMLSAVPKIFNEVWLVSSSYRSSVQKFESTVFRIFTLEEFERQFSRGTSPSGRDREIGEVALVNQSQILLAGNSLLVLFDERIAVLKREKPNSDDAIELQRETIRQYEDLKRSLFKFVVAVKKYGDGKIKEPALKKESKSFLEGVESWWTKSHETICARAYDFGLFGSALGLCVMAGAGGNVSVAVAAVLAGGKPVSDAIKSIAKSMKE